MDNILTKPVSMLELFYDLVFVYMISRATDLIHHLNQGVVNMTNFLIFAVVIIVFINSWMVQTVYTNRYGQPSWTDVIFTFTDMMIVLYLSNSFNKWQNHQRFFLAASLLSFTLCLQYLITYRKSNQLDDRKIATIFSLILGFRAISLLLGGLIPTISGVYIALIGTLISWIAPGLTGTYTKKHPIIFSHLLERLTLLIIITFGETIVGIAPYFTPEHFSIWSILIFMIVANLFFTYITEFDHLIETQRPNETGNLLIYLHYLILFGISLITVALHFIDDRIANKLFATIYLYSGLLLFYSGIIIASYYNRFQFKLTKSTAIGVFAIVGCGLVIILSKPNMMMLTVTSALVTSLVTALVLKKLIKRNAH